MLKTEQKQIGAHTYKVTQLGAILGRKVFVQLPKLENGTPDDFDFFCNTFAKQTLVEVEGGRWPVLADVFDIHFAGRYEDLLEWLAFCVEVNFGSFLAKARSGGITGPGAVSK